MRRSVRLGGSGTEPSSIFNPSSFMKKGGWTTGFRQRTTTITSLSPRAVITGHHKKHVQTSLLQRMIIGVGLGCCFILLLHWMDHEAVQDQHSTVMATLHQTVMEQKQQQQQQPQPQPQPPPKSKSIPRDDKGAKPNLDTNGSSYSNLVTVQAVRDEFYHRYGGKDYAESLLAKGIHSYGSVQSTARRILKSAANNIPFVLSFAGYSVTVGRGNFYSQSYPFVLGRILEPLLQESFKINVTVRNSAIGGIPSYPYAFCFEHFLGQDADVISWDFSMNEGKGAAVMESYVRQSQHQLPNHPMMIVLDNNPTRCSLVEQYASAALNFALPDAMCVTMPKDIVDSSLLKLPEDSRAPGFRHWDEFGAPENCPGRGTWHPKKMEHELLGWMMAMYFAQAVEEAQGILSTENNWRETYLTKKDENTPTSVTFAKPLMKVPPNNPPQVTNLLFGHVDAADDNKYQMKQVSCRTNFLPATDEENTMSSIVISGLSPGITADNIMQERNEAAYQAGWVLDVSKVERDTKVKVEQCGGLGYVDLKTALYGIPASGTLRLWLPTSKNTKVNADATASNWLDELIICEANEKRSDKACQLDKDIQYTVGGSPVQTPVMVEGAGEYLKRKTCVHVGIPANAKMTRLGDVQAVDGTALTAETRRRLVGGSSEDDRMGLQVDLTVTNANVNRKDGACCLSHIVWEQH